MLGQEAVAGKSHEITAIPRLLERLELAGALVTIDRSAIDPVAKLAAPLGAAGDAIGCQTRIARAILAKGADHLLAVKANRPGLRAETARHFQDVPATAFARLETTDGDHGRIEIRRHLVTRDVAWLTGDRRHPGEPRFPGLAVVGMVAAEVERAGTTSIARRYDLSSMALDAATFARAVRAHRGIENRLHWVLDLPRRPRPAAHPPRPREHGHGIAWDHSCFSNTENLVAENDNFDGDFTNWCLDTQSLVAVLACYDAPCCD